MNDVRFSSAVHLLILVSEAETPLSSKQIAQSIGTNPSWVRKLATALRRAGIIESRPGKTGFALAVLPDKLTLLQVYRAACERASVHVFDAHRNPSDRCIVGRHIGPVIGRLFADVDEAATCVLEQKTLADCIDLMRKDIEETNDPDDRKGA